MVQMDKARRLLGAMAVMAADGIEASPEELARLQRAIEQIWHAHAVYLAPRYGAVAREAGYIACGPVLAPVYLVEDIPDHAGLTEIADIGLAMRVATQGTICLSGSVALLRALEYVGDLDFCEYAECRAPSGSREVAAAVDVHARRTTLPICQRVKVVAGDTFSCDGEWDAQARAVLEARIDEGKRHLKLDFVASTTLVGVVEATNVVLLLEDDPAATIAKSFAGQEVPIGRAGVILPRPIGDPVQLGRYINFLRDQVEVYLHEDPLKALKRGLSLARIMFLDDHGEALVELLRDEQGALAAAIAAREALLDRLATTPCPNPARRAVLERLRTDLKGAIERLSSEERARPRRSDWPAAVERTLSALILDTNRLIAGA